MKSHPLANILRRGGFVIGLAAMLVVAAGGAGMAAAAPDPSSGLRTVTPVRVLDTRSGLGAPKAPLGPQSTLDVEVTGVPKAATAVVVNVTVVNGTAGSFLTISAKGDPQPITSTINWNTGYAVANGATVALNDSRHVSIFNAVGSVDVIVDLIGYYTQGSPGPTGPTGPAGPAGPAGDVGPAGVAGSAGVAGPAGDVGPAGVTGPAGAIGATGLPGAVGAAGDIGPAGPIGEKGADGTQGAVGPAGPAGADGPAGPAGKDGTSAGPAGSVYLQAFNSTAETVHRATAGDVLTFDAVGDSTDGITFTAGKGSFVVVDAGVYKVTFSITAVQANQFDIRVNGGAPDGGAMVFGAAAGQPNVGTAILKLLAGDVVTLENLTSTGAAPAEAQAAVGPPAPAGDVTLPENTGGSAKSLNASIVIEQLNAPPVNK